MDKRIPREKDVEWIKKGIAVDWRYQQQIGKAGMGYLRTGDEAYLRVYRDELVYFLDWALPRANVDRWHPVHSLIDTYFAPLGPSSRTILSSRPKIDASWTRSSCRSPAAPRELANCTRARFRTITRSAEQWTRTGCPRYFKRRYRIAEADEWLETIARFFSLQLEVSKPREDHVYYAYRCSLLCTLLYALATDNQEYLDSRALREGHRPRDR